MQRPHAEGLGVEDLVEAECAAEQAIYFRRARAVCWNTEDGTGVCARRGGIVMARLEQGDGEEVGAVGPCVEVGERKNLLLRLAIDRAIPTYGEHTRVRTGENGGGSHPGIRHEE